MGTHFAPAGAIALALTAAQAASATDYTQIGDLTRFTTGVTEYGRFTNRASLGGDLAGDTPDFSTIYDGRRVYGFGMSTPIDVQFSAATSSIRVFANIDHYGSAYDGYQYSIYGSTDGKAYSLLFDALSVTGSGEPFYLGDFVGTAPTTVNNTLVGVWGGQGQTGYIADFHFAEAYRYFKFGASTAAIAMGNADQELSGVGMIPGPSGIAFALVAGFGTGRRRRQ